MRIIIAAAALLSALCLACPTSAADLKAPPVVRGDPQPVVPAYTWAGFYAGFNAGYGAENTAPTNSAGGNDVVSSAFAGLAPNNLANAPRGALVGGQFGYNWQMGTLVVGLEERLDWTWVNNQSTSGSSVAGQGTGSSSLAQSISWLSMSNVKLGYSPAQHFMAYVTGGFAAAGVKTSDQTAVVTAGPSYTGSQFLDQARVGWNAGLGFEFAINSSWSLQADGRYVDLGTPGGTYLTGATAGAPLTINYSDPTRIYIGTVGLNYKF
jgi:outer membrane immunogenic protein